MKLLLISLLLISLSMPPLFAESPSANDPGAPLSSWSVTNSVPATNEITFREFLNEVASANLDYAAQRYNVDIAKAAVAIAKEFPNPTLSLSGQRDMRFHNQYRQDPATGQYVEQTEPEGRSVGIDQTIEYFGKRKWRRVVAEQAYHAAATTLDDFLCNLRLDASKAYVEALATQLALEQQRKAAGYLNQLVAGQGKRFLAGDIGETDFTQSRVGELQAQNDLLNAENDARTAQLALSTFLGRNRGQTTFLLRGKLDLPPRNFNSSQLIASALQNRADLIALRHARDSATSGIRLAKANRVPDVDVSLNLLYNTETKNIVNPTQSDEWLTLGISVPLPLWHGQRAEIKTAQFTAEQAQKTLESAELKAEVQVRQTFNTYETMQERVQKFHGELLKGADDVLAAKRYSYEHGQTTLLDLLDAQRADNDVRQNYNAALADAARALIELERAAELWDIDF